MGVQSQDWGELQEALTWGAKFKEVPKKPVININHI